MEIQRSLRNIFCALTNAVIASIERKEREYMYIYIKFGPNRKMQRWNQCDNTGIMFSNLKNHPREKQRKAAKDFDLAEYQAHKSLYVEESARRRPNKLMW